jgi:hypothetical protein
VLTSPDAVTVTTLKWKGKGRKKKINRKGETKKANRKGTKRLQIRVK